jgi:hypothetical protein
MQKHDHDSRDSSQCLKSREKSLASLQPANPPLADFYSSTISK